MVGEFNKINTSRPLLSPDCHHLAIGDSSRVTLEVYDTLTLDRIKRINYSRFIQPFDRNYAWLNANQLVFTAQSVVYSVDIAKDGKPIAIYGDETRNNPANIFETGNIQYINTSNGNILIKHSMFTDSMDYYYLITYDGEKWETHLLDKVYSLHHLSIDEVHMANNNIYVFVKHDKPAVYCFDCNHEINDTPDKKVPIPSIFAPVFSCDGKYCCAYSNSDSFTNTILTYTLYNTSDWHVVRTINDRHVITASFSTSGSLLLIGGDKPIIINCQDGSDYKLAW